MPLPQEVYNEFEAIVGSRNISQDKAILETYRCAAAQSSAHYGPYWDHLTPLPQAVILPGSTEEVQAIVRLCDKYDLRHKAGGSFWGAMAYISNDWSVQLDMRRMRSIEIDVKNQIAVIDPYVNGAMLQAEAMKYGLSCNMAGVGASSSIVASCAGWLGVGPSTVTTGSHKETALAMEWVLPTGEILRTGSLGSGDGWFCGEGPGPSTRAALMGFVGTLGEMGVMTKLAVRLYPWPGPAVLPSVGPAPSYKADLPDNFRCYTLCFPNWEAWADALDFIYQTDVAWLGHRQFNMFGRDLKVPMLRILNDNDGQLADLEELLKDEKCLKENEDMKIEFSIVIAGQTKREMELKEATVEEILKRTGGWKSSMALEPDIEKWIMLYLIRMGRKNLNFVMCGAYEGCFGLHSDIWVSGGLIEEAAELKRKWEKETTAIAATGGDSAMLSISAIGGGGQAGYEFFCNFDAYEKESVEGTSAFFDDCQRWTTSKGLGADFGRLNADLRLPSGYEVPQEMHNQILQKMGPATRVFTYQYQVREALVPNKKLWGSYYRALDPELLP